MDIMLRSGVLVVEEVIRKTRAVLFKNLKVGDKVEFSVAIRPAGYKAGGSYSTYIKAKNLHTGEETKNSFNQLPKLLDAFKFSKYEERGIDEAHT